MWWGCAPLCPASLRAGHGSQSFYKGLPSIRQVMSSGCCRNVHATSLDAFERAWKKRNTICPCPRPRTATILLWQEARFPKTWRGGLGVCPMSTMCLCSRPHLLSSDPRDLNCLRQLSNLLPLMRQDGNPTHPRKSCIPGLCISWQEGYLLLDL